MQDKRRYYRMNAEIPMSFRIPPSKESEGSATSDIAGMGIAFTTKQQPKIRQELLMYLHLPENKKTEVHGQVVRVEQPKGPGDLTCKVAVKLMDPIKFDERDYVKFYASKLKEA